MKEKELIRNESIVYLFKGQIKIILFTVLTDLCKGRFYSFYDSRSLKIISRTYHNGRKNLNLLLLYIGFSSYFYRNVQILYLYWVFF